MPLVQFHKRPPIMDRMFSEISDITNNMLTEDLFLCDTELPAINIKEHNNYYEIEVCTPPGLTKKDIEVSIFDDVLTISAESNQEMEENEGYYTRREFSCNSFNRTFSLPKNVDFKKKIKANCHNGVLFIHFEKSEVSKMEDAKKMIEIS